MSKKSRKSEALNIALIFQKYPNLSTWLAGLLIILGGFLLGGLWWGAGIRFYGSSLFLTVLLYVSIALIGVGVLSLLVKRYLPKDAENALKTTFFLRLNKILLLGIIVLRADAMTILAFTIGGGCVIAFALTAGVGITSYLGVGGICLLGTGLFNIAVKLGFSGKTRVQEMLAHNSTLILGLVSLGGFVLGFSGTLKTRLDLPQVMFWVIGGISLLGVIGIVMGTMLCHRSSSKRRSTISTKKSASNYEKFQIHSVTGTKEDIIDNTKEKQKNTLFCSPTGDHLSSKTRLNTSMIWNNKSIPSKFTDTWKKMEEKIKNSEKTENTWAGRIKSDFLRRWIFDQYMPPEGKWYNTYLFSQEPRDVLKKLNNTHAAHAVLSAIIEIMKKKGYKWMDIVLAQGDALKEVSQSLKNKKPVGDINFSSIKTEQVAALVYGVLFAAVYRKHTNSKKVCR